MFMSFVIAKRHVRKLINNNSNDDRNNHQTSATITDFGRRAESLVAVLSQRSGHIRSVDGILGTINFRIEQLKRDLVHVVSGQQYACQKAVA